MHDYFCDRCCVYNNQECVLSLFFFCDRSCDKYGLGVIHPHEFRSGIEKRLGYPMSEKQWEQVKCDVGPVSYTHLRAHETSLHLVCRLLLEKRQRV